MKQGDLPARRSSRRIRATLVIERLVDTTLAVSLLEFSRNLSEGSFSDLEVVVMGPLCKDASGVAVQRNKRTIKSMSNKKRNKNKESKDSKNRRKFKELKIPSASGRGTITRSTNLGWAFDPSKQDPDGCQRVEESTDSK